MSSSSVKIECSAYYIPNGNGKCSMATRTMFGSFEIFIYYGVPLLSDPISIFHHNEIYSEPSLTRVSPFYIKIFGTFSLTKFIQVCIFVSGVLFLHKIF